jgi:hypothetical protein
MKWRRLLFEETSIKVAFITVNTIQNIIKPYWQTDNYEKSGIYRIKCLDCPLKHIGQTGRNFHTRCKEHVQAIRSNNDNSRHSNHTLNTGHTCHCNRHSGCNKEKRKIFEHISN